MLLVLLRAAALVAAWSARPAVAMAAAAAAVRAPALRSAVTQLDPHPSAANCSELIFEQPLDHSDYNEQPTWQQSYFLCDQFLRRDDPAPLILFYGGLWPGGAKNRRPAGGAPQFTSRPRLNDKSACMPGMCSALAAWHVCCWLGTAPVNALTHCALTDACVRRCRSGQRGASHQRCEQHGPAVGVGSRVESSPGLGGGETPAMANRQPPGCTTRLHWSALTGGSTAACLPLALPSTQILTQRVCSTGTMGRASRWATAPMVRLKPSGTWLWSRRWLIT